MKRRRLHSGDVASGGASLSVDARGQPKRLRSRGSGSGSGSRGVCGEDEGDVNTDTDATLHSEDSEMTIISDALLGSGGLGKERTERSGRKGDVEEGRLRLLVGEGKAGRDRDSVCVPFLHCSLGLLITLF